MLKYSSQKGFTLIELLVVIAIIGLIGSIMLTGMSQSRIRARDARRKSDLVFLQKGLELYYGTNASYPTTGGAWFAGTGNCPTGFTYTYTGATGYIPNLAPTFVGVLPADPKPSTTSCTGYNYRSDGSNFKIISVNVGGVGGPETFPAAGEPFYDSARAGLGIMVTNNPTATAAW
jgi:general secretion pathway protein G